MKKIILAICVILLFVGCKTQPTPEPEPPRPQPRPAPIVDESAGTAYYLVMDPGSDMPESTTVRNSGTLIGPVTMGVNTDKLVSLTEGAKDIYVIVEDKQGYLTAPLKIYSAPFDPGDITAPVLSDGNVNRTSHTEGEISFTADEAGRAYYLVLEQGAAAPSNTTVKERGTMLDAVTEGENSGPVTLTAGAKDIFVVAEDAAGNISAPLLITASPFDPGMILSHLVLSRGNVDRSSDTDAEIGFTLGIYRDGEESETAEQDALQSEGRVAAEGESRTGDGIGEGRVSADSESSTDIRGRDILAELEEQAYDAFRRGIAFLKADNPKSAVEQFNIAIELNPDFMLAYLNRGTAYANIGEYDKAFSDFDHSASLAPDFEVIYFNRGVTYEEKGDTNKAMADYNQAIRLKPDYAEALNNRGNIYYNQGDYNRAIADYEAALRIDPSISTARSNLEAARAMRGR